MNARKQTCKLLEAMDEGLVDPKSVAEACLNAMSEDDVKDMIRVEELLPYGGEE